MTKLAWPAALALGFTLGSVATHQSAPTTPDNAELAEMYRIDQADRAGDLSKLDWKAIAEHDDAHQKRVAEMLGQDLVKTPRDYYHAAMVFQHASTPQGYKMAHELAMISAAKGEPDAKWLCAASWDRLLRSLKQNQRFATQYSSKNMKSFELDPVDPEPTDSMRKALDCPTLQEAKRRAKDF
ncbi:MAG: hypothetical protein JNM28_01425 [Armatimonadetes bacterium]|nr:hypothetical protein [Armatimonadota bacterium]